MAKGAVGTELLAFMMEHDPQARAAHYRDEAEKFRSLAAAETDAHLRDKFVHLARQYEQLAASLTAST